MCDIGGLALAPYLVPVFAGSFLMSISLMCFMRRSYNNSIAKIVAQLALLEKQVQNPQPITHQQGYYPPANYPPYPPTTYSVMPSAPL
jgi:hypothetical protein